MSIYSSKPFQGGSSRSARPVQGAGGERGAGAAGSAAALADDLRAGCERLGLELAPRQLELLLAYLDLLNKWNSVYNLTAIRDLPRMLVEHLFDSLAVVGPLATRLAAPRSCEGRCVVDIGSGAGLPGIPLAIVWPDAEIHLVEPVGKKAAFLRQCAASLGLSGVVVDEMRVEQLSLPRPADLVICRAFASLPDFLAAAAPLAGPDTLVCAMKGVVPEAEIATLDDQWADPEVVALAVPELDATRHLVLLRRASRSASLAADKLTDALGARDSRNGA